MSITTQNIFDILHGVTEKVDQTQTPDDVLQYIRLRRRVKERLMTEAEDTAHLHAMYVLDATMIGQVDTVDEFGWELLYNSISKREEIPLSFARGLTYGLTEDFMNKTLSCEVDENAVQDNQRILMGIVFDGVKKGFWELEDAKEFADSRCPDIPYFDKEEWLKTLEQTMGKEAFEDMADTEIPKGGDDVYVFKQ